MTMIAKLDREPVKPEARKPLTVAQKVTLLERQDYLCGCGCGESLVRERGATWRVFLPMIDEHVLPLDLLGSNDLSNRALYLVPCAKRKTQDDMKLIAKAARIRAREDGTRRPRQKIASRPFQPRREKP